MPLQGIVSYPGIHQWESFSLTDISGISPSTAIMDVYPQDEIPAAEGDLVITYGDVTLTFKDCKIDSANYVRGSGGKIIQVAFFDERWRWQFYDISGRYNFKFVKAFYPQTDAQFFGQAAIGLVDTDHEKTPQELAILCIKAMGYSASAWDVSALPNDARPEVNWVAANPAQELTRLCDSLGCRIVPVRSKGRWKIVSAGEGRELPENYPYEDPSNGIDPAEIPNWIKIVTGPILYESRIELSAVGKDVDGRWKALKDLSYSVVPARNPSDLTKLTGTDKNPFLYCDPQFSNISRKRVRQTDNSLIAPIELATQTVFRAFAMTEKPANHDTNDRGEPTIRIPGLEGGADVRQIVLTDKLVRPYIDPDDNTVHYLPAFVEGTFWNNFRNALDNYPLGTRIDRPSANYGDGLDDVVTFSLSLDEDSRYSMITFSQQMLYSIEAPPPPGTSGSNIAYVTALPRLFYHAAVHIREPKTWAVKRYTIARWVGNGPKPKGASPDDIGAVSKTVIKEDIQPFYRGVYSLSGELVDTINNIDTVRRQAEYYINSLIPTFETKANSTRTYVGIFGIDLDGQIQQVTYKIDKGGASTIASANTEHNWQIPTYDQRRQRDARKNPENRASVAKELEITLRQGGYLPQ
ncbi:hypothetical protein [Schlesneria paludicola]|uniref:hypothetical protein n=1 Tax=Schlesneria paludicola TaxID=360056 RepID=UPI00029A2B8D|nr:hypothetical protein [Schlesneria paludicola]